MERAQVRWMIGLCAALAALALPGPASAQQGPYSGVTIDSPLYTPIRGHNAVVEATGAAIVPHGANMTVAQVDGHEAAVTELGPRLGVWQPRARLG